MSACLADAAVDPDIARHIPRCVQQIERRARLGGRAVVGDEMSHQLGAGTWTYSAACWRRAALNLVQASSSPRAARAKLSITPGFSVGVVTSSRRPFGSKK